MSERPWKVKWRYVKHSGEMTSWRTFATYASRENAERATRDYSEKWSHMDPEWQIIAPANLAATEPTP